MEYQLAVMTDVGIYMYMHMIILYIIIVDNYQIIVKVYDMIRTINEQIRPTPTIRNINPQSRVNKGSPTGLPGVSWVKLLGW